MTLDEQATIIDDDIKSDRLPRDRISIPDDKKKSNFRQVIPEYINKDDSLEILIFSVNNATPKCEVRVVGEGITHVTANSSVESGRSRWGFLPAFWTISSVMSMTVLIVLLVVVLILFQTLQSISTIAPDLFLTATPTITP